MRRPSRFRVHSVFRSRHAALDYRPPPYLVFIKAGLTTLVAVAVVTIVYVLFWFVMASQLRDGIEDWAAVRRAEGFAVRFTRLEIGGFPFLLRATLGNPGLATPETGAPWSWSGSSAVIRMRPWYPWRVAAVLAGSHTVRSGTGGSAVAYEGTAGELTVELELSGGRPKEIGVTVRDLAFRKSGGGRALAIGSADLTAQHPVFPEDRPPDHKTTTFRLTLDGERLYTPPQWALPLGSDIRRLGVSGMVLGAIPSGPTVDSLAKWRDDGGTVEVKRFDITYGPLFLRGNGTMAFDAGLQPIGSFTARIQGFFQTIDVLRKRGLVRSRDAVTAKLVLGFLAKKSAGGGPAVFSLPLTLQDGVLYTGPVPLTTVPPVEWPTPPPPPPEAK